MHCCVLLYKSVNAMLLCMVRVIPTSTDASCMFYLISVCFCVSVCVCVCVCVCVLLYSVIIYAVS